MFMLAACAHLKPVDKSEHVQLDPLTITGDLELERLNDEELFAAATAYYAAADFAQAARYFSRIADFHRKSPHWRASVYNAGLALEKLKAWEDAYHRFSELSAPDACVADDSLDAAFRVAETLYHLERFAAAIDVLTRIGACKALPPNKRIEARVQQGVCELEAGQRETAQLTFRKVIEAWTSGADKDLIDDYFPAQAQFFLGETFRLHYEDVSLNADKSTDELAKDLEYKSELLLSAQGHYLRAIRIGNGYWATAAGQRIGGLYESFYEHMTQAPAPKELSSDEADVYRQELRRKIRVLLTKAITIYERTLETAERIGAQSPFVEQTKASLRHMRDLLLADADGASDEVAPPPPPPPATPSAKDKPPGPRS